MQPATQFFSVEWWDWFLKTGSMYGLGFIAIAGMLAAIFYGTFWGLSTLIGLIRDLREKWVPQVVSGHLTFLTQTSVTNAKTSEAVEKLTESYNVSSDNHGKTHRALTHIVRAQQLTHLSPEAQDELKQAIDELKSK